MACVSKTVAGLSQLFALLVLLTSKCMQVASMEAGHGRTTVQSQGHLRATASNSGADVPDYLLDDFEAPPPLSSQVFKDSALDAKKKASLVLTSAPPSLPAGKSLTDIIKATLAAHKGDVDGSPKASATPIKAANAEDVSKKADATPVQAAPVSAKADATPVQADATTVVTKIPEAPPTTLLGGKSLADIIKATLSAHKGDVAGSPKADAAPVQAAPAGDVATKTNATAVGKKTGKQLKADFIERVKKATMAAHETLEKELDQEDVEVEDAAENFADGLRKGTTRKELMQKVKWLRHGYKKILMEKHLLEKALKEKSGNVSGPALSTLMVRKLQNSGEDLDDDDDEDASPPVLSTLMVRNMSDRVDIKSQNSGESLDDEVEEEEEEYENSPNMSDQVDIKSQNSGDALDNEVEEEEEEYENSSQ